MLWLVCLVVILAFGGVVFIGAPYLPTLRGQVDIALDLIDLKPGQTLLELGCGDGRVLAAAAKRGLKVIGIEINPFLALIAWLRTRRYGGLVRVRLGDFWRMKWPERDGVFVFLVPHFMKELDAQMKRRGGMLVSVAFVVPGKMPVKTKNSVYLYNYSLSEQEAKH
jgi:protein-L-isoaspartate O-methyltransferase